MDGSGSKQAFLKGFAPGGSNAEFVADLGDLLGGDFEFRSLLPLPPLIDGVRDFSIRGFRILRQNGCRFLSKVAVIGSAGGHLAA
jgi:hypothetical protein